MQRLHLSVFALAVISFALLFQGAGCNEKPTPSGDRKDDNSGQQTDSDKPKPGERSKMDGAWGDIKGQVVWAGGDVPAPEKLNVTQNQEHCLSKGDIFKEEWVIHPENKGVRWTVVWLAPDDPEGVLPIHPSIQTVDKTRKQVMDQPCCKFEPHVLAMRQGEVLVAKNSSPINHSFKYEGIRNESGNFVLGPGETRDVSGLKAPGFVVSIQCTMHPWMNAKVWVLDHPYFAVTDESGRFEIKNAPAGKHRLVVWQEKMGWRTDRNGEPIEIKAGGTTAAGKLELKPGKP